MSNFYDSFEVGNKVEKKVYVNKVDSLISGLEGNIRILKKRSDLTLVMIKGKNGKDLLLPQRDQWWTVDEHGDSWIRLESKGKKIYFNREVAMKRKLIVGGRDVRSVLKKFEDILVWVKANVDLDTEMFYWSKDSSGQRVVASL